jgi:hypothetical protein
VRERHARVVLRRPRRQAADDQQQEELHDAQVDRGLQQPAGLEETYGAFGVFVTNFRALGYETPTFCFGVSTGVSNERGAAVSEHIV